MCEMINVLRDRRTKTFIEIMDNSLQRFLLVERVSKQTDALLEGLHSIIPVEILEMFEECYYELSKYFSCYAHFTHPETRLQEMISLVLLF